MALRSAVKWSTCELSLSIISSKGQIVLVSLVRSYLPQSLAGKPSNHKQVPTHPEAALQDMHR